MFMHSRKYLRIEGGMRSVGQGRTDTSFRRRQATRPRYMPAPPVRMKGICCNATVTT